MVQGDGRCLQRLYLHQQDWPETLRLLRCEGAESQGCRFPIGRHALPDSSLWRCLRGGACGQHVLGHQPLGRTVRQSWCRLMDQGRRQQRHPVRRSLRARGGWPYCCHSATRCDGNTGGRLFPQPSDRHHLSQRRGESRCRNLRSPTQGCQRYCAHPKPNPGHAGRQQYLPR